ncbi:hypothetical protein HPB50_010473 [Hyalomma asiaticum]|uniref:Uncharacterized protein n=1 Tax=Hyalomma asiaticum TaxID=266040 RepID=A0ACB7SXA4_HYAAI|nr:hypothetical protein HPB50_010473 [Hyalomma asiaticum]
MVGRNHVHPYTFFGRLPAGTTNVDVCVALVKTFKRTDLLCVQHFGAGRFEVTFKNKESVDRFLAHPVIEMKGTECKFEYRGVQTKVVRVFGFSKLDDCGPLAREMANYGKVLGVSEEYIPGWPEVLSGIRRVRIEMARPVPNLLRVEDKVVMCEYDGVVRLCRRCSLPGHHAAECETPKCERCGKFGDQTCSAACAHCGGDHGVFSCQVRTFASVASRTPTRGESSGVPAESEENFPTIERPPQPKGPAPGDQVSEKGGEKGESGLADASSPAAEVVPASPANEAAVSAPPDEPEQMELAGPVIEKAVKRRRKKGGKQMRRKRAQAEAAKAASDSDSDSDSSEASEPEHKRTALPESDVDSSSTLVGGSTEGEQQPPCPMCGLSDEQCECSALSNATYSSTN